MRVDEAVDADEAEERCDLLVHVLERQENYVLVCEEVDADEGPDHEARQHRDLGEVDDDAALAPVEDQLLERRVDVYRILEI